MTDDADRSPGEASLVAHALDRRIIATRLHDDPVQVLTVAAMRLDLLAASVRDDPDARAHLQEVRSAVQLGIDSLRRTLFELDPPALRHDGLAAALDELVARTFSGSPVVTRVDIVIADEPPAPVADVVFHVVCELLHNTQQHARAHTVEFVAHHDGDAIHVHVKDDGAGFEPSSTPAIGGLALARALVESAGGALGVTSAPGAGTTVSVRIGASIGAT